MRRLIFAVLLVCLVHSFAIGQQKDKRPRVVTPPQFRADPAPTPDPQSLADLKWFELFKDEKLQELIREALTNNYDVRQAVARIDAARADLGITRSEQFPTIAAGGEVITQRSSRDGAFALPEPIKRDRSFGSVLLNLLSFELDVWGRLRKQTEAATGPRRVNNAGSAPGGRIGLRRNGGNTSARAGSTTNGKLPQFSYGSKSGPD